MLRLPSVCVLCHQYHQQSLAVCQLCYELLKKIGPACHYCALPLPEGTFLICGYCAKEKPQVDRTFAAFVFEEPLRTLLHDFKYKEAFYLSRFLAKLISNNLPAHYLNTQCLIPIPMHPTRLSQRGFNQSAELCKILSRALKINYDLRLCKKIVHTESQADLDSRKRRNNLRNAFQANPSPYQHITLIDDLMTTGSTANEVARAFKKQGVERVDLWCCARAVSN